MASYRVLVSDPISEHGVELLNAHPEISADFMPDLGTKEPEKIPEIIGEYDAWIVRSQTKPNADHIAKGSKLKAIGRAGVGTDNIDKEAASANGVIVMNTPTGNTVSTAEHAFTLMLATARNIAPAHAEVLKGNFKAARKAFSGIELNNKRLAVIGMGRIGAEFTKRAQGFNMKVVAYDPFLTQARAEQLKIELAETADDALKGADVVTLHVPLTDDTRHILNEERLALLNKGALVVNCARGGLIDEPALKAAIESGHIAGCGFDVFEDEPPSADHILFDLPKHVTFTPHLGASTAEAQENVGIQVAEQIRDFLTTGEIRNAINMPSLDAEALAELKPYLSVAAALGKTLAKLGPASADALRVSYHGPLAEKDTSLLSRTILTSLLQEASADGQVNIVNSPGIAKNMGLNLTESTINATTEFSELLVAELRKGDTRFRVSGTIIGQSPRIVEIDRHYIDTNTSGHFLVVNNDDSPGMVGAVGTILGDAKVNIANMSLSRNKQSDDVLTVIEVDGPLAPEVMESVRNVAGIRSATGVTL